MSQILSPILSPVKGSSDISVSFSDASHSFYAVFIGLAFLEKVPCFSVLHIQINDIRIFSNNFV